MFRPIAIRNRLTTPYGRKVLGNLKQFRCLELLSEMTGLSNIGDFPNILLRMAWQPRDNPLGISMLHRYTRTSRFGFWTCGLGPQNYKRQNGKWDKGKPNRVQSELARRMRTRAVLARFPPPSLQSCIGLLRNFIFVISRNFHEIFNCVFS